MIGCNAPSRRCYRKRGYFPGAVSGSPHSGGQFLEGGHPLLQRRVRGEELHQVFPESAGMMKKAFAPSTSCFFSAGT
jgi:hypothetical protein